MFRTMSEEKRKVSFGFREVAEDEKAGLVGRIFTNVAGRYDLMNDLMSGGLHRVWKSIFLSRINPRPGETLLDLAGGTGDIAMEFARRAQESGKGGAARAIVCDINSDMLGAGAARPGAGAVTRVCSSPPTTRRTSLQGRYPRRVRLAWSFAPKICCRVAAKFGFNMEPKCTACV